jgi:hypothetical protein
MTHGTHNALNDPRNKTILIYVNGELYPRDEAKISVFDSGYLVGDGIWEAVRLYKGVLVFLDLHLDRLWQAAAAAGMDLKMNREELTTKIRETLDANGMKDGVHVRFMLTRGIKSTPSQDPRLTVSGPSLVIIPEYKTASPESRDKGVALFTSAIRREDTIVYDEPLYAHYLRNTTAREYHPGAEDVLKTMENDGEKVVKMMLGSHEKPVVFFKQMTHHLVKLDLSFLDHTENIILTRDPVQMLPSYAKEVHQPTMRDVGYRQHLDLLHDLESRGDPPVVLTSERVLKDPENTLRKLCDAVGISFDEKMLSWEKGPRPEDGLWAKYWYHSVHDSTGFKKYRHKTDPFPNHLKPLLKECIPIYQKLAERSI